MKMPMIFLLITFCLIHSASAETQVQIPQENITKECGVNEYLKSCPGCEPTCENQNPVCVLSCKLGQECQCKPGYVRNNDNQCINPKQCSNSTSPTTECGQNESLTTCPGCEPTCDQPNPICPRICRPGKACQCKAGFYRNSDGKCVQKSKCKNSQQKCPNNEKYMTCGTCEGSCQDPSPICTLQCRPEGCYCPVSDGYVRDSSGKCVKQTKCKRETGGGNEGTNPCAFTLCPVNTTCEVHPIECFVAPCPPPQAQCVPNNSTNNPQDNPCDRVRCPGGTRCELKQVYCIRAPCPPIAQCVNQTGSTGSCANVFCTADSRCINGKCVPLPGNPGGPISKRETPIMPVNGSDVLTCATILCLEGYTCQNAKCIKVNETKPKCDLFCPQGQICKLIQVQCVRAPCPPIPTCVPIKRAPIENPCATIECAPGYKCITVANNCFKEPCDLPPLEGQCVPNTNE